MWCGARNGPLGGEPPVADAGRAVDLGDLERLLEARRRQDPRQPPRQHRLARARRADHQQVVAAGGGDLERALGVLLPAHVGQVGRRRASPRRDRRRPGAPARAPSARGAGRRAASSVGIALTSIPSTSAASARVRVRHEQAPVPRARARRARRSSVPRTGRSSPLSESSPHERAVLELLGRHLPAGGEQPDRDREVEARARLAHVRGREVHRQPLLREVEPRVEQRRPHALARLPDRPVRQAHEREGGQPAPHVHLDGDLLGVDPVEREGGDRGEHPARGSRARPTHGGAGRDNLVRGDLLLSRRLWNIDGCTVVLPPTHPTVLGQETQGACFVIVRRRPCRWRPPLHSDAAAPTSALRRRGRRHVPARDREVRERRRSRLGLAMPHTVSNSGDGTLREAPRPPGSAERRAGRLSRLRWPPGAQRRGRRLVVCCFPCRRI